MVIGGEREREREKSKTSAQLYRSRRWGLLWPVCCLKNSLNLFPIQQLYWNSLNRGSRLDAGILGLAAETRQAPYLHFRCHVRPENPTICKRLILKMPKHFDKRINKRSEGRMEASRSLEWSCWRPENLPSQSLAHEKIGYTLLVL